MRGTFHALIFQQLAGVKLDDQVLRYLVIDILAGGQGDDLRLEGLRLALDPLRHRLFAVFLDQGLELGGVREPLPALVEADMDIVKEAAQMICDAKKKYL